MNRIKIKFKFSEYIIDSNDEPFKMSTTPTLNLGAYIFKYLNTEKITTEESFIGTYIEEVYR